MQNSSENRKLNNKDLTTNKDLSNNNDLTTNKDLKEPTILDLMRYVKNVFEKIEGNQEYMIAKIEEFEDRLISIESKFEKTVRRSSDKHKYELKNPSQTTIKELVARVSKEDVLRTLSFKCPTYMMVLVRSLYFDELNEKHPFPFRIQKGKSRVFEYYLNDRWIIDQNGFYIKKTICSNLESVFRYFNNDKYVSLDDVQANEEFIMTFERKDVQNEIFASVCSEMKQNTYYE